MLAIGFCATDALSCLNTREVEGGAIPGCFDESESQNQTIEEEGGIRENGRN